MGSICLSAASILRCDSLTRNQNIYLIIPTALEVVFSTSLVFIDRGPGKRNLLLTAEGLCFLILAILELLSQILPTVRGNLHLFKAFDLAIGIASSLPISLYTIFLYLLTNAEIVSAVPRRIKNVAKLALILFIPAIIIFNEIASFIGVSIRNIPADEAPEITVAIGFSSSAQQGLWAFFSSLTLALLTGFQAAAFCFALFRLTQAILDQRRIESRREDKAHPIKGIGWISGSLKLGALESVFGFAGGGFVVVLTRRILRLFARAFLCIGVAKGVDLVEDFRAMRNDFFVTAGAKLRRSQVHQIISNPRLSTFRQLSPKATTFHDAQQASDINKHSGTYNRTPATTGLSDMVHFANVRARNGHQRVTVRYSRGKPSLHMRFSALDILNPGHTVEETKSRPQPEWASHLSPPQPSFHQPCDSADSIPSFAGPFELVTLPRRMLSQRSARAQLYQATSGESPYSDPVAAIEPQVASREQSVRSIPDSLRAVHDLAGQFPGPPMAFKDRNTLIKPSVWEEVPIEEPPRSKALGSPSELQFKGNIVLSDDSACNSNRSSPSAFFDNRSIRSSRQPTLYAVTATPLKSAPLYSEKPIDPFNDDDEEDAHSPSTSGTADNQTSSATVTGLRQVNSLQDLATARKSHQSHPRNLRSSRQEYLHNSDEKVDRTTEWNGSKSRATRLLSQAETPTKLLQHSHEKDTNIEHLPIPWLKSPDIEEEDRRLQKAMSKRDDPLSRVKSVGRAPRKFTPLPVQARPKRGSMYLKPITIPSRGGNMPEILDEYDEYDTTATGDGILRGSEFLEMRDDIDVKGRNYF